MDVKETEWEVLDLINVAQNCQNGKDLGALINDVNCSI
jgi:hypothetical protein